MGRTLITLASSALVLSISVVQLLAGKITNPRWGWLLPVSWILFGVTVLAGAVRQGWTGAARSLRYHVEKRRGDMRSKVAALSLDDPQLPKKFDEILAQSMQDAGIEPEKSIKIHDALNQVMFWSLTLGLASLIAFAIRNRPF
jgi:hypothetical protein